MEISTATFPAIATITAALIGGFVAFLSSVLSKEQKTSEFRYAWLNAVLDDIANFAGAAESIKAAAWSNYTNEDNEKAQAFLVAAEPQIRELLAAYYRARIRLYPKDHKAALDALEHLKVAVLMDSPDPKRVDALIRDIVQTSHEALKREWVRVKLGEKTFRYTKNGALLVFVLAVLAAGWVIALGLAR